MIKTNAFFDFTDFQESTLDPTHPSFERRENSVYQATGSSKIYPADFPEVREYMKWRVREVFVMHVGGTRDATSSTDHNMYMPGWRWLLNVYEHVFWSVYFMCQYKDEYDQG